MTSIELVCFHHAGPHAALGRKMDAWLAYLLAQQRISCGMHAPEPVVVACYRAPHLPVAQELIL
jgi:surfactin synthase thioesterase subunit